MFFISLSVVLELSYLYAWYSYYLCHVHSQLFVVLKLFLGIHWALCNMPVIKPMVKAMPKPCITKPMVKAMPKPCTKARARRKLVVVERFPPRCSAADVETSMVTFAGQYMALL
jgi:hypothetical protein